MPQAKMRTLTALAMCNLLPIKDTELWNFTGQIINTCISVHNKNSAEQELDKQYGEVEDK
jgi:hypothetical protein